MEKINCLNEYRMNLGKLLANMLSLEMLLRLYLFYKEPSTNSGDFQLDAYKVDDIVPTNYLTNTFCLRQLVEKYNTHCNKDFKEFKIDPNLVDTRNALAHGRILSSSPSFSNIRLYNFSRDGDRVKLSFTTEMKEDWFSRQITLFWDAIVKVQKRMRNDFPENIGEIESLNS